MTNNPTPLEQPREPAPISRRTFLSSAATALSTLGVNACRAQGNAQPAVARASASSTIGGIIDSLRRTIPRTMSRQDIPGLSIALVHDGVVVWTEGFGFTDQDRRVPVVPNTPFSVGSVSKSFTALAVLRAVEQELLSLDAPIQTYLPWLTVRSPAADPDAPLTLRHLLSHHSGLNTWAPVGNPYDAAYHTRSFDDVVRSSRDARLKFAPGERFEYSNQGIDLAGAAVQAVRDTAFTATMREHVLNPLGMMASTFDQATVTSGPDYARPHSGRRAVAIRNGIVHPMLAAGGMVATASDLARLIILHHNAGRIDGQSFISEPLFRAMCTPQYSAREQPTGYGLALYKAIEYGAVRYSHGGLGFGISAHYRWLPEQDFGVVVLTNQDSAHNAPALAGEAVAVLLGPRPRASSPRGSVRADSGDLRMLAGTYLLYDGILETFLADSASLYLLRGRDRLRMRAEGENIFTYSGLRFTFVTSHDGTVRGVRITDPAYDVATTENSVLYLARNDGPTDSPGPGRAEWTALIGRYHSTFIGAPTSAELSVKNGTSI